MRISPPQQLCGYGVTLSPPEKMRFSARRDNCLSTFRTENQKHMFFCLFLNVSLVGAFISVDKINMNITQICIL